MRLYLTSKKMKPKKAFHVKHWLEELTYVHSEFNKFILLLRSHTLSRVFTASTVEVETSERPCELCAIYIEVSNEVTGRNIRAAPTKGKLVGWRRPILESDQEEKLRAVLHDRFVDELWDHLIQPEEDVLVPPDASVLRQLKRRLPARTR
ncbi:hypothetical protein C8Q76DRAFT_801748 [Earliella scabrosa]|nr:hypothetical protein C8Q76DRAFT_801748 [Earliella scabrosa]